MKRSIIWKTAFRSILKNKRRRLVNDARDCHRDRFGDYHRGYR